LQGVGITQLLHADTDRFLAVVAKVGRVGFGSEFGVAYVFELNDTGGGVLDNNVVELSGVGKASNDAHRNLIGMIRIRRRLADLAGGNLNVLLGERVGNVGCSEAAGRELGRVEPYAHGVLALAKNDYIADAGDP